RAIRRTKENPATFIEWCQRTALGANKRVPGKALRQHAIEVGLSAIHIVAAQAINHVPQAVEWICARNSRPKRLRLSPGTRHAHAKTTMRFEVTWQPGLVVPIQQPRPDNVIGHEIPIAANPGVSNRIVDLFVPKQSDWNKRRFDFMANAFV